jgi:hypothetical protein
MARPRLPVFSTHRALHAQQHRVARVLLRLAVRTSEIHRERAASAWASAMDKALLPYLQRADEVAKANPKVRGPIACWKLGSAERELALCQAACRFQKLRWAVGWYRHAHMTALWKHARYSRAPAHHLCPRPQALVRRPRAAHNNRGGLRGRGGRRWRTTAGCTRWTRG